MDWIAAQCEAMGLARPPGSERIQPVEFEDPSPAEWAAATALWAPRADARSGTDWGPLEIGRDAVPFKLSADGRARGELVFVGHGIAAPDLGVDDYAAVDVRGKIVLVLRGASPRARQAHGAALRPHLLFRTKVQAAADAGAVGFVLCNRGDVDRDDPRRGLRAGGDPVLPAFWVHRKVAGAWFGATDETLARREARLDADAAAASARGALGVVAELRVELAPRQPVLRTANVLGWIPGTDPSMANEVVVVGAHHDHLGRGIFGSLGIAGQDQVHPGADDNASGVAALLELARLLQADPPQRSVAVVFFGAEELGQRGSRHFLASGVLGDARPVAMVNFDMVGRARSQGLRVEGVSSALCLRARVEAVAEPFRRPPAESAIAAAGQPGDGRRDGGLQLRSHARSATASDQRAFLARGVPALTLTSGFHEHVHKPTDVDCLVEVEAIGQVVRFAVALVRDLANGAAPVFAR